jgi:hypothetical protein
MYECDPAAQYDDNKLPDGLCNDIYPELSLCTSNIATGWAVGGDDVRLRTELKPIMREFV